MTSILKNREQGFVISMATSMVYVCVVIKYDLNSLTKLISLGGGVEPFIRAPFKEVGMNKVKVKSVKWKVFTAITVRVMLNLFQHLTGLVYLLQACKILKQVQDDNEGVNEGVNIDVKGGYKAFTTNLGMFNSNVKGGYKDFAKNLEIFNSGLKGRCKTCLA